MRYRIDTTPSDTAPSDGRYDVVEDGDVLATGLDVADAVDAVYLRVYRRAFELAARMGWSRVHAVTADLDGRRLLLVGPSGVGKTTLALALAGDGAAIGGDESVLVKGGDAVAVPRGFHVKAGTIDLVPEFAAAIAAAPTVADVSVVDPRSIVPDWRITATPVDHIVLLDPTADPEALTPAAPPAVLQTLVRESFLLTETKQKLVAALLATSANARCWTLARAPLPSMLAALREGLG